MHAEKANVEDFTKLLQKLLLGSFYFDASSLFQLIMTFVALAFCLGNQEKKLEHSGEQLRQSKIWTTLWRPEWRRPLPFSPANVTKAVGRHCPKLGISVICLKFSMNAPKERVCSINKFTLLSLKFHSLSCSQIKTRRKHSGGFYLTA